MKAYKINEISHKRILGRNISGAGESQERLNLFWGASALEVNVKAKEVWINVKGCYDQLEIYIVVEINGAQVTRFLVPQEDTWFCIARNLNPQKENLISIIKDTQAMPEDILHMLCINQIGLDEKGSFCELAPRTMKIEFIGDSLTSGEGLAGRFDENDWIPQWLCASKTYAIQTAKTLNADWNVMSLCGWGLCWSYDGNRNHSIPQHYEKVCGVMKGQKQQLCGAGNAYDFGKGSDVVVIALGTNDNSAFFNNSWIDENGRIYELQRDSEGKACDQTDTEIQTAAINFLTTIRKHNPKAKIIWMWGLIKLSAVEASLISGIEQYKKQNNDNFVSYLITDSMDKIEKNDSEKGSREHPGPLVHKLAAEKLVSLIKQNLGL